MLGTTTCTKVVVKSLPLGSGLTVTEINRKRVQKQENMNISNVKRCMDGTPKDVNKVRMI